MEPAEALTQVSILFWLNWDLPSWLQKIARGIELLKMEQIVTYQETLLFDMFQLFREAGDIDEAVVWLERAKDVAAIILGPQHEKLSYLDSLKPNLWSETKISSVPYSDHRVSMLGQERRDLDQAGIYRFNLCYENNRIDYRIFQINSNRR